MLECAPRRLGSLAFLWCTKLRTATLGTGLLQESRCFAPISVLALRHMRVASDACLMTQMNGMEREPWLMALSPRLMTGAQKLENAVPAFIIALASRPIWPPVACHSVRLNDIAVEIGNALHIPDSESKNGRILDDPKTAGDSALTTSWSRCSHPAARPNSQRRSKPHSTSYTALCPGLPRRCHDYPASRFSRSDWYGGSCRLHAPS